MSYSHSNPVLGRVERVEEDYSVQEEACSYKGVAIKTGILLFISAVSAYLSLVLLLGTELGRRLLIFAVVISIIGTFVCSLVGSLNVKASKVCAILYAVLEGIMIGLVSLLVELLVPGAAFLACTATFSIVALMLVLYSTRIVKVTNSFLRGLTYVMISTIIASVIVSVVFFILGDKIEVPFWIVLAVSVFYIGLASVNLLADFNRVELIVSTGKSKKYEWQLSMGLMVTILWLYIEILRFIALIAAHSKDN